MKPTPKKRKRGRPALIVLGLPTFLFGGIFSTISEQAFAAGMAGAVVGFFIGLAILAFPNLDRGGPADTDDIMLH